MVMQASPSPYNQSGPARSFPRSNVSPLRRILIGLAILTSSVAAFPACAQLQQPFVYTTGGAIAIRNDSTGTSSGTSILILTPSANSNSGKALQFSPVQLTLVVN
jgi:hypothetical protein